MTPAVTGPIARSAHELPPAGPTDARGRAAEPPEVSSYVDFCEIERAQADQIDDYLRAQMPVWRTRYPGVETMKVAVMGCIVNGPGESKHANIGISLPGTGEAPAAPVFVDGKKVATLRGADVADQFKVMVADYIEQKFGNGAKASAAE